MKSMRAKVKLRSLTEAWSGGTEVEFVPVTGDGSPENKAFHNATPGGSFKATLSKEATDRLGPFVLGKEYYVDFTACEQSASA